MEGSKGGGAERSQWFPTYVSFQRPSYLSNKNSTVQLQNPEIKQMQTWQSEFQGIYIGIISRHDFSLAGQVSPFYLDLSGEQV